MAPSATSIYLGFTISLIAINDMGEASTSLSQLAVLAKQIKTQKGVAARSAATPFWVYSLGISQMAIFLS